jgi:hypothetical protein
MLTRICACASLVAVVTTTNSVALTADTPIHSARITLPQVTRVCGHYLSGDYIVVHDDGKMAAGEPCTTFYRLRPGHKAAEIVLSFYCIPRQRTVASETTITTTPTSVVTTATQTVDLLEFQIAGEAQAHGVPPFDVHSKP